MTTPIYRCETCGMACLSMIEAWICEGKHLATLKKIEDAVIAAGGMPPDFFGVVEGKCLFI